jgi:drug/metabolite transporter (DMT)-like permease
VKEAENHVGALANTGNCLILTSILLLAAITVAGMSGFVRGGEGMAMLGLLFSALSGGCTALVILFSVRLNNKGVGPLAQFGLRFVFYTVLSVVAFLAGTDDKGVPISNVDLSLMVLIGLLVIALPLYLVQKAVPLLPVATIAAITALGPVMVFVMQTSEGRVAYSAPTLLGLVIYTIGACLIVYNADLSKDQKL